MNRLIRRTARASPRRVSSCSHTPGLTEDEKFVQDMLTGCRVVKVRDKAAFGLRDKAAFGRELAAWGARNVREI
jgi:hypothetical protein